MVLAVDAGHQMKKDKVVLYMFLTIIGGDICRVTAWEWKNFIKGEYGAIETKGGSLLQFVDKEGHRVALADFAVNLHEERAEPDKAKWFMGEGSLPSFSVAEVQAGLNHPDILSELRFDCRKAKNNTFKKESELRLSDARYVVEGANLKRNEYGSKLFADFFFLSQFHGFHVLSGVIINIIIFFNVLVGTYEKRGSYEMVEKVGFVLALCRFSLGICFTVFYLV
jgi:cytochrome c oxidase subunit 3